MRNSINKEDIDFYREYGFVRIRALLNREEVEHLTNLQESAVRHRGVFRFPPEDRIGREKHSHDLMYLQRLNLWRDYEPIREFAWNKNLGKIVCDLAGVDVMRLWNDACFRKLAWANPTLWHYDVAYWSFNSSHGITAWVALNESNASNGGLHFMPGSHREIAPETTVFAEDRVAGLFDLPNYQKWKKQEAICLPLEPGDCTFHNGLTLHGSGTNMTPYTRNAWTCSFMPDGSVFNGTQNVLPDKYFESLRLGDLLDSDDINPIIYG